MSMPRSWSVALLFAAISFGGCAAWDDASAGEQGVRAFLMGVFDRPEARLSVPSVALVGDYAVAGWVQSGHGGRTLLKRSSEGWEFVVCGGAGLTNPEGLVEAGLDRSLATQMAAAVRVSEASLSVEQHRLLGDFQGLMKMEGVGHPSVRR
jgi:hypothetical protein